MGIATIVYCRDYDGYYPFPAVSLPDGIHYWWALLEPYTHQPRLYLCPDGVLAQALPTAQGASHYGVNALVLRFVPLNEAGVRCSASTYLAMDAGSFYAHPGYLANLPGSMQNPHYLPGQIGDTGIELPMVDTIYQQDARHGRHSGGVNVLFCDGHVKWMRPGVLIAQARQPGYGDWNSENGA